MLADFATSRCSSTVDNKLTTLAVPHRHADVTSFQVPGRREHSL